MYLIETYWFAWPLLAILFFFLAFRGQVKSMNRITSGSFDDAFGGFQFTMLFALIGYGFMLVTLLAVVLNVISYVKAT